MLAAGHLGRNVTELFLDVALIDLGGTGKSRLQASAREQGEPILFQKLRECRQNGLHDQPYDVIVAEPCFESSLAIARWCSQRLARSQSCEVQPLLKRMPRAGHRGGRNQGEDVVTQDRFLLYRRTRALALDLGQHGGYLAVLAVECKPAPRLVPGNARKAAADRANGESRGGEPDTRAAR